MLSIRMGGLFYGWVVLGGSFLTMASVYTLRYSFSFFFVALLEDFPSWGRAATASILSVNVLVYGLALPVVGSLVDRLGPRRVMSLGVVLVGLGAVLLSRAQELWQFYLLFGLVMALGICLTGWVPNTTVLSRSFVRRRGPGPGGDPVGLGLRPPGGGDRPGHGHPGSRTEGGHAPPGGATAPPRPPLPV